MNKKVLALYDGEESYLRHMAEYMERKEAFPFAVYAFSKEQEIIKFAEGHAIEILLVAENSYHEGLHELGAIQTMVLNESGNEVGTEVKNINKYQTSEKILGEVLNAYAGAAEHVGRRLLSGRKMKIIGNYTPVRRCLQTTFALCMGQMLAKKHKVLYLNFESYSGMSYMLNREFSMDITDVLYFFNCEREKLAYRMAGMVQSLNGMDFIPPVIAYRDIAGITGEQWLQLFQEMEVISEYEYLILDLSEQMQGLFEILRECYKVFTITREDSFAASKLRQYEEIMQLSEYEDIALKTKKWRLPLFHHLPDNLTQLTHGELAAYVKKIIEEDIYGQTG